MSLAMREDGQLTKTEPLEAEWRDRLGEALEARKQFEPTWLSNLAFAAGKHWLAWDPATKKLRHLSEMDPRYADVDLYTADVITEYRAAALGELQSGDERPELLLAQAAARFDEELQSYVNRAVAHGWDHEWMGDEALASVRLKVIDLGVGAIRCRFDPNAGPARTAQDGQQVQVPFRDGNPLFGDDAMKYAADTHAAGGKLDLRAVNQGRIVWDVGSPFNLLVPPGTTHESDFTWDAWVRPVPLDALLDTYPNAAGMREDGDIGSIMGLTTSEQRQASQTGDKGSRLRDHVWLTQVYQRPSRKLPKGRVLTLAGSEKRLIEVRNELPVKAPDGCYRSGISYFHWWRRTDAFWSRALIENLKDPQRMINRRKTQNVEIIDRGMPFVLVEEDSTPQKPTGKPMELVELKKGTQTQPVVYGGNGPGAWMYNDIEGLREDLAHASTLSNIRLGENPTNVNTYSALAVLNEAEQTKRQSIETEHQGSKKILVENCVDYIRRFWGSDKKILVSGDDTVEQYAFDASKIPDFYVVKVASGAAKPRSQAAELQKVDDVKNAAIQAQVFDASWVQWYRDSLDAGQVLELPKVSDDQAELAEMENHALIQGEHPIVAYWHRIDIHLPIHRRDQDQALISGDMRVVAAIEEHVQEHLRSEAEKAAQIGAMAPPPLPGQVPGQPAQPGQPSQPGVPATSHPQPPPSVQPAPQQPPA